MGFFSALHAEQEEEQARRSHDGTDVTPDHNNRRPLQLDSSIFPSIIPHKTKESELQTAVGLWDEHVTHLTAIRAGGSTCGSLKINHPD